MKIEKLRTEVLTSQTLPFKVGRLLHNLGEYEKHRSDVDQNAYEEEQLANKMRKTKEDEIFLRHIREYFSLTTGMDTLPIQFQRSLLNLIFTESEQLGFPGKMIRSPLTGRLAEVSRSFPISTPLYDKYKNGMEQSSFPPKYDELCFIAHDIHPENGSIRFHLLQLIRDESIIVGLRTQGNLWKYSTPEHRLNSKGVFGDLKFLGFDSTLPSKP